MNDHLANPFSTTCLVGASNAISTFWIATDLSKAGEDPQKANIMGTLTALQRTITAVETAISLLTDGKAISSSVSACNCEGEIARQLRADANAGTSSAIHTIVKADQKRHVSVRSNSLD